MGLQKEIKRRKNYTNHSEENDTTVRDNVEPSLMWINEAGKLAEPQIWGLFAHYAPHAWIFLGDRFQLYPTVRSKPENNPFLKQIEVSLFTRLIGAGLPHSTLIIQRYMAPEISSLVNTLFYNGILVDDAAMATPTPLKKALTEWNEQMFGVAQPVLLVNVADSVEVVEGPTRSTTNFEVVQAIKDLTRLLLESSDVRLEDLVVLSLYEADFCRFRDAMYELST